MSAKKSLLWVVTVLLVVAAFAGIGTPAANAAPPQQDNPTRTITVTGTGTAYGTPDIVTVGLGVESVNSDVKTALDETNTTMSTIIAALQDNGVAAQDIRTENFSIYQDYSYGTLDANGQDMRTYRVSTSVTVTVRDAAQVSDLLALAVDAGANMVNYIQFDIEDNTALQADARALAVADAQARAENLAGLVGMTIGAPVNITESDYGYGVMMMNGGGLAAADSGAISEGQLSVSMSVAITFEMSAAG